MTCNDLLPLWAYHHCLSGRRDECPQSYANPVVIDIQTKRRRGALSVHTVMHLMGILVRITLESGTND